MLSFALPFLFPSVPNSILSFIHSHFPSYDASLVCLKTVFEILLQFTKIQWKTVHIFLILIESVKHFLFQRMNAPLELIDSIFTRQKYHYSLFLIKCYFLIYLIKISFNTSKILFRPNFDGLYQTRFVSITYINTGCVGEKFSRLQT